MNRNSIPIQNERLQRRHLAVLGLIFLISISSLILVYTLFPQVDPYVDMSSSSKSKFSFNFLVSFSDDRDAFKLPKTMDDAKILGNVLYKYSKHHRYIIMIAFFLVYIL